MIIFYHKDTGQIFGTINGRVDETGRATQTLIKPSDVPNEVVGRYVVEYKPNRKMVKIPKFEVVVKDGEAVKKVVGYKKTKQVVGLISYGENADFLEKVQRGEVNIFDYIIKDGKFTPNIEPKQKATPQKKELPCAELLKRIHRLEKDLFELYQLKNNNESTGKA
jgi:hypothetical protein